MQSAAFNLDDFDDGPTAVTASPFFNTAVMDRRQMPPPVSGVMPVSAPVHPASVHAPVYAAPSYAPPSVAPPSIAPRRISSPEFTQPALRVRRDLAGTRRLAWVAIGFAFVFGLAGAFTFQTMNADAAAATAPTTARAPRSVTERSSTLDTKSTPDALPRAEAPLASARRTRHKRLSAAAPPVTTEAGEEAPAAPAENDDSIEGRDLLGEGIGQ